jgi:glycyl-tRNA synthetase beta chain
VALFGSDVVHVEVAGIKSDRTSRGHRFLAPETISFPTADAYVDMLRAAHVLVDPAERARVMHERLLEAAKAANGTLIEDEFLIGENLSLVEEPHVIVGGYEDEFLKLPERVILAVAKGHQRYFGVRGTDGKLLPRYLSVVNTALAPENIRRGNDCTMRARLSDARFFYGEDVAIPLADRRTKLGGIVFQKRLGTMLGKATRIERLAREVGLLLSLPEPVLMAAASGAHLAKCDLVSLMVGEFPELEGEMGRAYALAQGVNEDVADVIREHYQPKGAHDATPKSDAGALVSIADRLDTIVGCFAIGLSPTGASDPYGLRRACIGILRVMFDHGFDLRVSDAIRAAYDGYGGVTLDLGPGELADKLGDFFTERLRGLLADKLPQDAVAASLAVAYERPIDARARATALAQLDAATRANVGEVFKRATNIAENAPAGEPVAPRAEDHASERAVYDGYVKLRESLVELRRAGDYGAALREVAGFAPLLQQYFLDVFVMTDDIPVRENRLRLMRAISEMCSTLARFELLGER